MKVVLALASVLAVSILAPVAHAGCASDIQSVKERLARETNPQIKAAVGKEVAKAELAQKGSEIDCNNAVTRAWRAFTPPKPVAPKKEDRYIDPAKR